MLTLTAKPVPRSRIEDIIIKNRVFDGKDFIFGKIIRHMKLQNISRNAVIMIKNTRNQYQSISLLDSSTTKVVFDEVFAIFANFQNDINGFKTDEKRKRELAHSERA